MRLPIPGPAAVIGGAAAAADAVESAIRLVPRATEAMTRVEALLDRVERVVDRAEQATDRTHQVLDGAEIVTRDAGRTVDGSKGVLDRLDTMLSTWEPTLRGLAPSAKRFAESLDPAEITAAIGLIDRLPVVLDHVEGDVLPVLQKLDRVGPDLHELLEVVEDLRRVVTGLPGVGLLRRRGGETEPPTVEDSVHDD
jgi:hypothetical protein